MPACRLRWYAGSSACDVLQAVGGVTFLGDSLTRHLLQSIVALPAGDLSDGLVKHMPSLNSSAGPLDGSVCRCAQGYDDGHLMRFGKDTYSVANTYCRIHSAALVVRRSIDNMRAFWPEFCPRWHDKWFLADHHQDLRAALRVVWLQGGLHSARLDAAAVEATFFNDRWGRGRPGHFAATRRFVYSALHAPGKNKSPVHQATHGLNKTQAFNRLVRRAAARDDAYLFDSFATTLAARSIDGQHYFMDANVASAQLLLNVLAAIARA